MMLQLLEVVFVVFLSWEAVSLEPLVAIFATE